MEKFFNRAVKAGIYTGALVGIVTGFFCPLLHVPEIITYLLPVAAGVALSKYNLIAQDEQLDFCIGYMPVAFGSSIVCQTIAENLTIGG